jgi:hypothetical protein
MEKILFDIYNSLKGQYVNAMLPYLKAGRGIVTFSPYIMISLPRDNDEFFEEIESVSFDEKENTWYVHNYITNEDLEVNEYYTPLRDMTFEELFKISERL